MAEGKLRFRLGTQLFDSGRFREAAAEYETAFRLTDRPGLLFNIGQAYRLANDPQRALAAYQGYLRRNPNAPERDEVIEHIRDLQHVVDQAAAPKTSPPATPSPAISSGPTLAQTPTPVESAPKKEVAPRRKLKTWTWIVIGGAGAAVALAVGLGVGLSAQQRPLQPSFGSATLR